MTFDSDRQYDAMGENYPFIDKRKEEYTPEEAIKILTEAQMYNEIKKCIEHNGLEGTEDVIKRAYSTVPKLREKMLRILYLIWDK